MTVEEPGAGEPADPPAPGHAGVDVRWSTAGTAVCRIIGDLDLGTVDTARAALERVIASKPPLLVVDLSGVAFCDSAGLNLLLQTRLGADTAGVAMRLASLATSVVRVFELTGADTIFSVHASVEEAEHG
jgi:anti-anti-sigma factor